MEQKKIKNNFSKILIKKGKVEKSEKIFYKLLKNLKKENKNKNPLKFLNNSLTTLSPKLKIKKTPYKRLKKFTYLYIKQKQQQQNAIKNIINNILINNKTNSKIFLNSLLSEIINLNTKKSKVFIENKIIYQKVNRNKSGLLF